MRKLAITASAALSAALFLSGCAQNTQIEEVPMPPLESPAPISEMPEPMSEMPEASTPTL